MFLFCIIDHGSFVMLTMGNSFIGSILPFFSIYVSCRQYDKCFLSRV